MISWIWLLLCFLLGWIVGRWFLRRFVKREIALLRQDLENSYKRISEYQYMISTKA